MRQAIACFLGRLSCWLDGSGWHYDEFGHGYREGMKAGQGYENREYIRADLVDDKIDHMKMQNAQAFSAGWDAALADKEPD